MTPYEHARADLGSRDGAGYLLRAGWEHLPSTADWCSAAMKVWHLRAGVECSRATPAARSWLHSGEQVELADAREGDVIVLWRGKPGGWQGHVAFLAKVPAQGEDLLLLGGNTRGAVAERAYPLGRLLGIRRFA